MNRENLIKSFKENPGEGKDPYEQRYQKNTTWLQDLDPDQEALKSQDLYLETLAEKESRKSASQPPAKNFIPQLIKKLDS